MKQCPKCGVEYFDEMLEFCLEDGMNLVQISGRPGVQTKTNPTNAPTVNLPQGNLPETINLNAPHRTAQTPANTVSGAENSAQLTGKITSQSHKVLEVAPIVIALAHNWWQWLYLEKQSYYSFSAYVVSANFLMWLLLLAAGAAVGFLALKHCRNKGFAYTSLVVLAINLILFLVPNQ